MNFTNPHAAVINEAGTQRRSSSRSIRRKKFDDELVEFSARYTAPEASHTPMPGTSKTMRVRTHSLPSSSGEGSFATVSNIAIRRSTGRARGRSRHSRHSLSATKDLGRWKPTDDLALYTAVSQTCDLRTVERGVKFSCRFTYSEISQRWHALLYDPVVSRVANAAIRNLHPDMVAAVYAKALYSVAEEELLANIKSTTDANLETFEALLRMNPLVFHHGRTAKSLMAHWTQMKQYQLLKDQHYIQEHATFSDVEERLNDQLLMESRDECLDQEIMLADRRAKREIRTLEEELSKLQVLVEMVPGGANLPMTMDSQTLAVIRGRAVRYLMRSKEVTIGRNTKNQHVDVDLNLEAHGLAMKVSRRQGTIRMRNSGDFFICNEGKRPLFVDGRPILSGNQHRLGNNSVLEIAGFQFVFLVNQTLVDYIRVEALKQSARS